MIFGAFSQISGTLIHFDTGLELEDYEKDILDLGAWQSIPRESSGNFHYKHQPKPCSDPLCSLRLEQRLVRR